MAIRINNTTVIDDSRNAVNIPSLTFSDGTVQRTAAPVFGDTVTAGGSLLWTLNNPNAYSTSQSDQFAYHNAVGISGNYAIVGAYNEDDAGGGGSGKAYVFNVATGQLIYTLNNPNAYSTSGSDNFGISVAISGNFAIVGAYFEDDAGGTDSGKAYIFDVRTGGLVWTLNNPNAYGTSANDLFGFMVAISGNFSIVTAYGEDDAGGLDSGKVYVFNVTTGQLLWTLNNPNAYGTSDSDFFGFSIGIDGNFAVVGAWMEDDVGGGFSGKAYIFNVTTGALVWTLNNPNAFDTIIDDGFGFPVAISGNFAIVGAYQEDAAGSGGSGRAYVFNVTTGQLVSTLDNPNAYSSVTDDNFSATVAISGNYAVVGAPAEDDATGTQSGKAYIYNVTTGQLLYTLNNPNAYSTSPGDFFGRSAFMSGNYVIISARNEDDAGGTDSGKAYIFNIEPIRNSNYVEEIQFTNGTTLNLLADKAFQTAHPGGSLVWTLNNPNAYSTGTDDVFGLSVAISGNYAIVGAWQEDDAGGTFSGKAYVFNITTGALAYRLDNPNPYSTSAGDDFGFSVAIDGNYAIISALEEDDAGGTQSGKAYIYNVTTGQLLWTLNNPNAYSISQSDYFGQSVSISGNYAIVGAHLEDDAGGLNSGKAYIFNVTTGQLLWTLNNPNAYSTSENDGFGSSVSISGNFAIVGVYNEEDAGGTVSGKAYIFNVTTGALVWTLNNPNAYSTSAGDWFGYSVSISGNYAIVGAFAEADTGGSASGKAYIYNVTTGSLVWTLNNPNAYGTSTNDRFGYSVCISGNYAIVGAYLEDETGGFTSGKAYIFNVTTGALLYILNNPNTYSTVNNDQFGYTVAISGNYAIVGVPYEDDAGGLDSGKAYIFSTQNLTYLDKILTVAESIF